MAPPRSPGAWLSAMPRVGPPAKWRDIEPEQQEQGKQSSCLRKTLKQKAPPPPPQHQQQQQMAKHFLRVALFYPCFRKECLSNIQRSSSHQTNVTHKTAIECMSKASLTILTLTWIHTKINIKYLRINIKTNRPAESNKHV